MWEIRKEEKGITYPFPPQYSITINLYYMKKFLTLVLLTSVIVACGPDQKSYKFLDNEHKSFYVNGVSAIEGYSAVIKSLEEIGFEMGEVTECNLSFIGKGITYYTVLKSTRPLTQHEYDQLTNGLFVNLPSGDVIFEEVNHNGCGVYLSWYKSGMIDKVTIQASRSEIEEDAIEINKRLASLFPYSKVSNSRMGYLTYYNDYGVQVYYTNDYFISIEKK